MPQLRLKRFDMSAVTSDSIVVMLGKRRTGKSFLCRDLLSFHQDLPTGVVISGTESSNGFFGQIFPPLYIFDEYKPQIIENLVKRQRAIVKKAENDPSIDPRCILIMDDCLYDRSWTNDVNMRQIFMNGRHLKLGLILTSQYPLGIPPNLRSNVDFTFILRENVVANRRRIYDNYCGMLPQFEVFCSVLDQTTENYECLVVNNFVASNKLEDQLFYYKAEDRPAFTIGCRSYWSKNNAMLDSTSDDEDPYDVNNTRKKRENIVVKKVF
jgi:hypothetical protein